MKCNVATFWSELPNVIISDFKTYFQLTSRDIRIWKTKSYFFFLENDTDAENCCLENILVSKSGHLRVSVGSRNVTIYKFSGECSPRTKYFQQHRRDGVWSYFISTSQFCNPKMNFTLNTFPANVSFLCLLTLPEMG